jgi:hypothetical protein
VVGNKAFGGDFGEDRGEDVAIEEDSEVVATGKEAKDGAGGVEPDSDRCGCRAALACLDLDVIHPSKLQISWEMLAYLYSELNEFNIFK